ncbi:hypothetical protein V1504DRAFT_468138 [Lipomyces starkeyi]
MLPFQLPVTTSSAASTSTNRVNAHQLVGNTSQPGTFIFPQPNRVPGQPHSTELAVAFGLDQLQISALESAFADNPRPNPAVRQEIARSIGITSRIVQVFKLSSSSRCDCSPAKESIALQTAISVIPIATIYDIRISLNWFHLASLWFQERRKRAKDEKQLESTRVEMILAAAGSPRHQTPQQPPAVELEDDERMVAPERPTTPPLSRPSSASPIKAQADQQIAPPATPAKTPTRTTPAIPVTPVQRITRDHTSPTKYASPSEASYASLERSLVVAEAAAKARNEAAAAAAAAYAHSPYTVVPPGATGGYFYSPHHGQVHSPVYVAPGTPGFPGAPQAPPIGSPFVPITPSPIASHHPHGQYLISPIPLQRAYSMPGPMTELQQQPQVFSPLAAPSLSDSKLAARRRRQGPPAVRLRRSHSYSATVPGEIPSAPAYMMTFSTPSAPASGAVSPVKSMAVTSTESGSGLMRRSKSVSFVQCQEPLRARKLSLGGAGGNGARNSIATGIGSNISGGADSWTQEQEDRSKPQTPITPVLSTAGSLMEVDDHEDSDRLYKRVRRHAKNIREVDDISTDEDEPRKRMDPVEHSWDDRDQSPYKQPPDFIENFATVPSSAVSSTTDTPVARQFASRSMSFEEPHTLSTANTTASMHAAAAELFMSSADCTNTVSGISDAELAALEQNQRLLMLTRQLDDLGIYGYGVLNDFT